MRTAIGLLGTLLLTATGCAGDHPSVNGGPAGIGRPVELTFPYLSEAEAMVPGYRASVAAAAGAYVRIVMIDPGGGLSDDEPGPLAPASGAIVDRKGYIVTVAHIARDTKYRAEVTTMDGRTHAATVIDVAPSRELALLKIRPYPGMVPAVLGESGTVKTKDFAFAIGSPRGRPGVATLGWVRTPRLDRTIRYNETSPWILRDAIRLSMETESGHSGGPVFNADGKLIGLVAGHEMGNSRRVPYVSPRITYAVPADAIADYLASLGHR